MNSKVSLLTLLSIIFVVVFSACSLNENISDIEQASNMIGEDYDEPDTLTIETNSYEESLENYTYKLWKMDLGQIKEQDFYDLDVLNARLSCQLSKQLNAKLHGDLNTYLALCNIDMVMRTNIPQVEYEADNRDDFIKKLSEDFSVLPDEVVSKIDTDNIPVTDIRFVHLNSIEYEGKDAYSALYSFQIADTGVYGIMEYMGIGNDDFIIGEKLFESKQDMEMYYSIPEANQIAKNWFDAIAVAIIELDANGSDYYESMNELNDKDIVISEHLDSEIISIALNYCSDVDGIIHVIFEDNAVVSVTWKPDEASNIIGSCTPNIE